MRIVLVLFTLLVMCSVVGCGEMSEQIRSSDVAPETSETSGLATDLEAVPAAPPQPVRWHALKQKERENRILDRAYKDLGRYLGDEKDDLKGECKAWVQDVVFAASNGAVYPPKNHTEKDRWIDDPKTYPGSEYCIGRCALITSAIRGEIVQVRWKESFREPPDNLHTFIVVSVNASALTVIDSNWRDDKTVREHRIDIDGFNENADSFSIYYIR